jgi:hypothetical protein
MSVRNHNSSIKQLARRGAVAGLALSLAAFAPAVAWGGCGGGGGGGGGNKSASVDAPPAPAQNDPAKIKQLKDLAKKLKAEMRFDNQKNADVRRKENAQAQAIEDIIGQLPDHNDPIVKDADMAVANLAIMNIDVPIKYGK